MEEATAWAIVSVSVCIFLSTWVFVAYTNQAPIIEGTLGEPLQQCLDVCDILYYTDDKDDCTLECKEMFIDNLNCSDLKGFQKESGK